MSDTYASHASGLESPGSHAFAVTPNNDADLAVVTRGVYVGGTGTLKVTMLGGEEVTFTGLAAGMIHPIRASRIWSTGTSATGVIGIY